MKQIFKVNGMSCGSCKHTVEKALQDIEGVTSVQVNMNPPEAIIETVDSVIVKQLNSALSKAGNYSLGDVEATIPDKSKGGCCCG